MVEQLRKTVERFLKKLKIKLPYDPAIPLQHISKRTEIRILKKKPHSHVFAALFTIAETTQVSIEKWIDKENVVYICTIEHYILYPALKKEGNLAFCNNMDEARGHFMLNE